jgi:hypothetical protein
LAELCCTWFSCGIEEFGEKRIAIAEVTFVMDFKKVCDFSSYLGGEMLG